ncbi:STAS domain-containing protein [Bacillus lacus]|uniref:STAS domain-containing protein n=1 Tax=Metabacillus lacus TaxID=1983721 RepID=A0A7X2M0T8_9BACI|nr:STAS domain-containing protein [Metabacillus lacus]MRX73234.1 STAS domain-containing protein [Metabacillus lacus]
MTALSKVASYLIEHCEILAGDVTEEIVERFPFEVPQAEVESAKRMYSEFLFFLGESINCTENSVPETLQRWSKGNGERAAASNAKISDIFIRYPDTRMVFSDFVLNLGKQFDLTSDEIVLILKRINHLLDLSINETVFAYEARTDFNLKEAQEKIRELASPVVPIQEGIAILPLIGKIDTDRAEHLLNKVVPELPHLEVNCLILDFSGIVTIDTDVASHIFNLYNVLRLLGINVIFTGIRPELATKVIHGGIDFSSHKIYANVREAIKAL